MLLFFEIDGALKAKISAESIEASEAHALKVLLTIAYAQTRSMATVHPTVSTLRFPLKPIAGGLAGRSLSRNQGRLGCVWGAPNRSVRVSYGNSRRMPYGHDIRITSHATHPRNSRAQQSKRAEGPASHTARMLHGMKTIAQV